jgi:hypothetical protein
MVLELNTNLEINKRENRAVGRTKGVGSMTKMSSTFNRRGRNRNAAQLLEIKFYMKKYLNKAKKKRGQKKDEH